MHGAGEQAAARGRTTRLRVRVRRLYEQSAMPVRENARLVGDPDAGVAL